MSVEVEAATKRAVVFLASAQLPTGNFTSGSSATRTPFKSSKTYHTTFTPALILASLNIIDTPLLAPLKDSLAQWLLSQKSPAWSFNYWAVDAPERQTLPYPDDLDDTFCALLALYGHDTTLVDEACLGQVVKLLIAAESKVGGPYRTWLVGHDAPAAWQDTDLAVNCNIAALLNLVAEPLPNLTTLMEQAITAEHFQSPYYPSVYPILYFLARAYRGSQQATLARCLLSRRKTGRWGTPLQTALAISALCQLGAAEECKQAVAWLQTKQCANGSWQAEAFCIDPAVKKRTHYSGTAALTTALVLEALHRYANATKTQAEKKRAKPHDSMETLFARIKQTAQQELRTAGIHVRPSGLRALDQITAGKNGREIILLPSLFHATLTDAPPLASALFEELGLANLYGWLAYTIYDDFLDDEGNPRLLPVANIALRYSVAHFRAAQPDNAAYQQAITRTFDAIDNANAWEITHCRFTVTPTSITLGQLPGYGDGLSLADRSLGHTLTPLGVLAACGIALHGKSGKALLLALRHYLAARQLNDDLHDWEEDLRRGHITFVVASILDGLALQKRTYKLATIVPSMQRFFWRHRLPSLCGIVQEHTKLARQYARKSGLLTDSHVISHLLDGIDAAASQTLDEQIKAEQFLAAYSNP